MISLPFSLEMPAWIDDESGEHFHQTPARVFVLKRQQRNSALDEFALKNIFQRVEFAFFAAPKE